MSFNGTCLVFGVGGLILTIALGIGGFYASSYDKSTIFICAVVSGFISVCCFGMIIEDFLKRFSDKSKAKSSNDLNDLNALFKELVITVQEALNWGKMNGYPIIQQYPQYRELRSLGKQIHAVAGFEGMQEACRMLQYYIVHEGGGKSKLAENAWEGIGGWMA